MLMFEIQDLVLFSWFENITCNNACKADETTLFSEICFLWIRELVPTLIPFWFKTLLLTTTCYKVQITLW